MRKLPDVMLSPCPPEYARLLAQGWDSTQEAYALEPTRSFIERLEEAQQRAKAVDECDGIAEIVVAGRPFKIHARGAKRYRWRLENDDFIIPRLANCRSIPFSRSMGA
jgi:hypothetical protein